MKNNSNNNNNNEKQTKQLTNFHFSTFGPAYDSLFRYKSKFKFINMNEGKGGHFYYYTLGYERINCYLYL